MIDTGSGIDPRDPGATDDARLGGAADARAEAVAETRVQAGEAPRATVEICDDYELRLREVENAVGLLLEIVHELVIAPGAPKAHWDRKMIPVWKAHIERKRKTA